MTTHTQDMADTPSEPRKSHDMLILAALLAFIFLPTLLAFGVNMLTR